MKDQAEKDQVEKIQIEKNQKKDNAPDDQAETTAKNDATDQEKQEVLNEFATFGSCEFLRIKGGCTRVSVPVDDFLP